MTKLEYIVKFNTPAFLGNAFQEGQWRTPPFKALLRQWWRIVKASELLKKSSDPKRVHIEVREAEGKLFGHAWLSNFKEKRWAMQGRVKIRLSKWRAEVSNYLPEVAGVHHPEVTIRGRHSIDPFLYLGYGAIFGGRINNPISTKDGIVWTVMCDSPENEIRETIKLIHLFGTIGGRCRNGWGSLVLKSKDGEKLPEISEILDKNNKESRKWLYDYARYLNNALELDWCHAIGKDEDGLFFWRSKGEFPSWEEAMRQLAEVKIALRTQFHFKGAGPHDKLCDRQILAYPVNKHSLHVWGNARSANQLFFKVHKLANGRFVPIIVHLPHGIPEKLREELSESDKKDLKTREQKIWVNVHKVLDPKMQRLS